MKYIIDVPDDTVYLNVITVDENVNNCKSINVKDLQNYEQCKNNLVKEARISGYRDGYKAGYEDGRSTEYFELLSRKSNRKAIEDEGGIMMESASHFFTRRIKAQEKIYEKILELNGVSMFDVDKTPDTYLNAFLSSIAYSLAKIADSLDKEEET